MDAMVIAGAGLAAAGIGTVAFGLNLRRQGGDDAVAYLSGLDGTVEAEAGGRRARADRFESDRLSRPLAERIVNPIVDRVVSVTSAVTPSDQRIRVRTALAQAGLDGQHRPEDVLALQAIGAVAGTILGALVLASGLLPVSLGLVVLVLLVFVGAAGPMGWLKRRVEERQDVIRQDLPDMLDLLAITVEAGVGLEGAMTVVSERLDSPLAAEMTRTLREMELGLNRRDALTNLRQRSPSSELSAFVHALIQADALGMPLTKVLKVQASEMRVKRRQWAREKAAKLPVKILIPLVLCIFPAVLVVVLGPAFSQIGKAL